MNNVLQQVSGVANRATELLLAPIVAFFTGLMILSVISRYVFQLPIVNAVEMIRLAFVWACFLGAAAGVRRFTHVRVTFLVDWLPYRIRPAGVLVVFAGFLVFAGMMVWYGVILTRGMSVTFFPTLAISQAWLYAALPVSGALIGLHALAGILATAANWSAMSGPPAAGR